MKKIRFYFASAMVALALASCGGPITPNTPDIPTEEETDDSDDSDDSTDDPIGKDTVLLSANEQKNYLVEIGEQLLNTFNPADQEEAAELAADLYNKYQTYDWSSISNVFANELEDIYSSEFESFFGMPQRLINAINGKQKASLQDLEIILTLSKFGRVIEFDDQTKSVKITKTDDPSITAKFSDPVGTKCELKVYGEGKEIEASYTYSDYHYEYTYDEYGSITDYYRVEDGERTIRVKVPTTIKMYLKQGSTSLIAYTFKWDTNIKDYVNTSLKIKVLNLGFEEETKVSTSEASAVFSFTYNDKTIISAAASLPKYQLIGWENGKDITEEDGESWLEEYGEKYASLLGKLGKGEAKINILNKVQLKGGFTDGAALIDEYYNWSKKYGNYNWDEYQREYTYTVNYKYWDYWYESYMTESYTASGSYSAWWERPLYSLEAKQAQCDYLNKYAYLSMYFNNGTTEQAKILMDTYQANGQYDPVAYERQYDSWSGAEYENYYTDLPDPINYTCYEIEPVMYFPKDDVKVAVMTFFNSSKFLGLIDLVEDLANSYIALDKNNLIFWDGFEIKLN